MASKTTTRTAQFTAAAVVAGALATAGFASAAEADTTVPATTTYRITLDMSECGVMYLGTQGTCITSLQTWMNWSIGSHLPIDGYYGADTLNAVEEFQRTYKITPNGRFGTHSREALARWFVLAGGADGKAPCDISTGDNCDAGAAEPGLDGGVAQTVLCAVVSKVPVVGEGAGVFCDVVLD
jgi:peptidoglycan hydrolase-like protein with peptidoglycan-binding domain